jgi:hypothetical protein
VPLLLWVLALALVHVRVQVLVRVWEEVPLVLLPVLAPLLVQQEEPSQKEAERGPISPI